MRSSLAHQSEANAGSTYHASRSVRYNCDTILWEKCEEKSGFASGGRLICMATVRRSMPRTCNSRNTLNNSNKNMCKKRKQTINIHIIYI